MMSRVSSTFSCIVRSGVLVVFLVLGCSTAGAQNSFGGTRAVLHLDLQTILLDSTISLPHQFILPGSDVLFLDSLFILRRDEDYRVDYRKGNVILDSLLRSTLSLAQETTLVVAYEYLPFSFKDVYTRRTLTTLIDTISADSIRVATPTSRFGIDDIFGADLQKSGSIVRGLTVGSNRDLTLNSGLRMQLAGKISTDVEIRAALTDENTPIQPEGTTQTLQEFDKVFVEIESSDYLATLGDFVLGLEGTEFARVNRKLQGAKGSAMFHPSFGKGGLTLSAAATRGKYHTNQFMGLEGVQGPYRLGGRNNERQIIVIAGTEKVFINGELQVRGETNDYTIDYSLGEVVFTARRLITSASRIVVDFEYTDRQYARTFLAGQTSAVAFGERAGLTVSYLRESDDQNNPIDFQFADSLRAILAAAGDSRERATFSGVTQVDSNGLYIRVDTTLAGGESVILYRYAPGDPLAQYLVTFSFVGPGKGDYVRRRVGEFEWRGPRGGEYLPIRFLPFAQSHEIVDVAVKISPLPALTLEGELARSSFDMNRLSSLNDDDNAGHAINVGARFAPRDITIGGKRLGGADIHVRERFVDGKFVAIDRTNDIEFGRRWGVDSLVQLDEEIQEASLAYHPVDDVSVGGAYGKITRGDVLRSVRNEGNISLRGPDLPRVEYTMESIRSREVLTDNSSKWFRQRGAVSSTLGDITPRFRFETEDRAIRSLVTLGDKQGSFAYQLYAPGVEVKGIGPVALGAEYEWRSDNLFFDGSVTPESKSFTQAYSARLSEWNALSSTTDLTLRRKSFNEEFKSRGSTDIRSVLVRNQTRYAPLSRGVETDIFYQVVTERSSRLERVFVRVTQGSGNYRYLGDLNRNGLADESEFELTRFDGDFIAITTPSEELFPVIDLKTSLRLRVQPRRFLAPSGFAGNLLTLLSTETYVRVDEKSSEDDLKQIYLLHFSRFQQAATTLSGGTLFTQDVHLQEGNPAFSSRLRFLQRKGINRLSSGIERNFVRERSIRLRWQLIPEIANQIDFTNKIDALASEFFSTRARDIQSNGIVFDLSYRPEQDVEVGMKIEIARSIDRLPDQALDADLNAQTLRFVYALRGAGQIRVETAREEVLLGPTSGVAPFELTGGRVQGKTWLWRGSFDYRITQFIQATFNYDGRSEGGRTPVHTARAEVRAFF